MAAASSSSSMEMRHLSKSKARPSVDTTSSQRHHRTQHFSEPSAGATAAAALDDNLSDDDFWGTHINIDTLIGDPVHFDFPSQLDEMRPARMRDVPPALSDTRPVGWNFMPSVEHSHSCSAWNFSKQSSALGAASDRWKFRRQLQGDDSNLSAIAKWKFLKASGDGSDDPEWTFLKQSADDTTISWHFKNHGHDPSKIVWRFPNQCTSTRSLNDWYFKPQTKGPRAQSEPSTFDPQVANISPVPWPFSPQTPELSRGRWGFVRQTADKGTVVWRFTDQLGGTGGGSRGGVKWTFAHQSPSDATVKWNFAPNLQKAIHDATLNWKFRKNLETSGTTNWDFESQVDNIRPLSWNLPSMTEGLAQKKDYEEIIKENQTFKENYSKAFVNKKQDTRRTSQSTNQTRAKRRV